MFVFGLRLENGISRSYLSVWSCGCICIPGAYAWDRLFFASGSGYVFGIFWYNTVAGGCFWMGEEI
jgi:hypothetical protein